MSEFIQVGFTSLRDPTTGDFLPAVPLFIQATKNAKESEAKAIEDISSVFADKMKQYIDGGGVLGKASGQCQRGTGKRK